MAIVGPPSAVTARLARVAERSGGDVHRCEATDATPHGLPAGTTVVLLVPSHDTTETYLALVPALHRRHPSARLVVVGDGTDSFDAFFDVGVDVWIDRRADDDTVAAALAGPGWRGRR